METVRERISNHPFFRGMRPEHLLLLARAAREISFETNEIIFREGEPACECYLIESGQVLLEIHEPANGTVPIETLGQDEVLGWSWLFPPFEWHLQARATQPTTAIVLDGAHLLVSAENDRDFGYELMKRMVQVLINRLQATRGKLLAREAGQSLAL